MNVKTEEITALYVAEHKRLERQIARRVGCPGTASDLVHDIFIRLWERTAERLAEPAAYLTRSARNAAIDHVRAEKRRSDLFSGILPEQWAAPPVSPDDAVAARQELRGIDAALAALPTRTRHIFLLNRVHGKSFSEIAEALGISRRAVTKHMARAVAACERGEIASGPGFSSRAKFG
ncbi:sigma-70 family RNA polymerase sigma factor [Mesorhizobium sp. SB112]|uniref:RNA polymerase sigma factor n=1 Tax=Mesorhizobium sp. SB112 TaxID=3151853 RepID=UPI00326336A9